MGGGRHAEAAMKAVRDGGWSGLEIDRWTALLPAFLPAAADPPPWQTWWAYAFAAAAVAALLLAGLRAQRRQIARERSIAERERAINRDLRELADLKDLLLADRAAELAEREELIAELRARNEELARFNYTVSHDLKNPLSAILGSLDLLDLRVRVQEFFDFARIDILATGDDHVFFAIHQIIEAVFILSGHVTG